jgi:tRNA(Ile)-lysidine synthase
VPERPRLTPAIADVRRAVRDAFANASISQGQTVLVACSGGADSLALAAAVAFEAPRSGIVAGAVIVDHQMQAGSAEVAKQVKSQLTGLGLGPVVIKTVAVGNIGGPEAAAREARYSALNSAADELGATAIVLGHTIDDQAETVLLGLARGSGARSLQGMASVSGRYLRPMLTIPRQTTEAFCVDSGLSFWQDPMNQDEHYARVRVRKNLLPALEAELGPGVASALARTADQFREDEEVLSALAESAYSELVSAKSKSLSLPVDGFKNLPLALRHRVLASCLEVLAASTFARVHILAVDELVDRWHGQKPLTLPGVRVERLGDRITLTTTKTLKPGAC